MKRAAIYIRVSRDEQAQNFSLPTQRAGCEAYAAQHNLHVVAVLADDETGATLERTGLDQLRGLANDRQIEAVILYSTDRFHRDLVNQLLIRRELQALGVEIHYVRRGQLKDTPEDRFTDNIEAAVAEYERERIRERTMRGTRGKAEAGRIPGGGLPKYGYRYEGQRRERQLLIDEPQAAVVREIHERYNRGDGVGPIARDLTERQVPTWSDIHHQTPNRRRPFGSWDQSAVYGILRDEAYAGRYMAFRHVIKRDGKQVQRDAREWVPVPCPAIIDRTLWQRNQERLDTGVRLSPRRTRRFYLLRGLLRCGLCGSAMLGATVVRPTGRENRYYKCGANAVKAVDRCRARHVPADRADDAVWAELQTMLDREELAAALERIDARPVVDPQSGARASLTADLAAVQNEIDRYLSLYGKNVIRLADLEARLRPLNERRDTLEAQQRALGPAPDPPDTSAIAAMLDHYDLIADGLAEAGEDVNERRRLIELARTIVTVTPLDAGQFRLAIASPLTDEPRTCII